MDMSGDIGGVFEIMELISFFIIGFGSAGLFKRRLVEELYQVHDSQAGSNNNNEEDDVAAEIPLPQN